MESSVETKQGRHEIGNGSGGNRISGDVTIERSGGSLKLRPTFEAALEIEDQLGGLEALRTRAAGSGLPGMGALTTREIGVIISAGIRATGEGRATPDKTTRIAWEIGRKNLRKPVLDFLWALTEGGRERADDLKKEASSNGSSESMEEEAKTTESLIQQLHGDDTSA